MHLKHQALIVFLKNPVAGRVKTRLAAETGHQAALAVYLELIKRTREAVTSYGQCDVYLYFSDHLPAGNDTLQSDWAAGSAGVCVQSGDDLGSRMHNAFCDLKDAGYKRICIIGTDCPGMSPDILLEAFHGLDSCDLCIGPALDGGYYLLGMQEIHPWLFAGKQWSTATVLKSTLGDASARGISVHMLPKLRDLDDVGDLYHFPDLIKLAERTAEPKNS
jgi:uncharacterized protein